MLSRKDLPSIFLTAIGFAAAIGIISVFLSWFDTGQLFSFTGADFVRDSFNVSLLGNVEVTDETGTHMITRTIAVSAESFGIYRWMPIIVILSSAAALMFVVSALHRFRKWLVAAAIAAGAVSAVAAIMFFSTAKDDMASIIDSSTGVGLFLAIVAGLMIIVFGVLRLEAETDEPEPGDF